MISCKKHEQPYGASEDRLQPKPIEHKAQNSTNEHRKAEEKKENPKEAMLDVPLISQNPELKYGCEVTSLTMVLHYAGIQVDKMKLANELPKDSDPVKKISGDIQSWGNPDHGFVGDITGKKMGYAVYAKPLEQLMRKYLPDQTVNLTGKSMDDVFSQITKGKPVVVWTTGDYKQPDRWETWKHGNEEIHTPLDLHAVVLVGFDPDYVYINDPLTGKKAHKVERKMFIRTWEIMGKQALTYN
ncbi:C39 family peptidase [Cohnella sp.]|uniref:C39 family peptidase n=1 Tax=Cohnella sp. TaxID=1883426 RepID=UPI0035616FD2